MLLRNLKTIAKSACIAAAIAALPETTALAADHRGDDRGDRYRRDDNRARPRPSIGISFGGGGIVERAPEPVAVEERVWVEPVYRTVSERTWAPPVYRTVTDRVWVEPVVRTIPDRKWVPDQYEWRDVVYRDHYGRRCVRQEHVLVERAHFVDCPRTVEIAPGRWDTCTRQELVCEGRWETCDRQELVSAGYWTTRTVIVEHARPTRYESSHARIDLRFPIGR
ncbi:MAG: hypothetical protein QOF78_154 [Phycisphaerales bacterium]|nr:hypothetical protein [Phycisphaerales bacterium]